MESTQIPRMSIVLERVYESRGKSQDDTAVRILVDRLWPRGIRKEDLPLDRWAKEWAPSPELRKKFHDGTVDFPSFKSAYRHEVGKNRLEIAGFLQERHPSTVVLLYGSKDPVQNNAAVFKEVLEEWMG